MREVSGNAYAKVNFTLDILDKRPDGYHEIRSIMQTISLHDRITIRSGGAPGIRLNVTGEFADAAPVDDSNLVIRAARVILDQAGIDEADKGLDITLEKNIPAQAGLGGGSSDSATTLVLIDQLFELDLPYNTKLRLASKLGSDVPFFLTGGTCLVEGFGEKVSPVRNEFEEVALVVCKSSGGISTAFAYQALDNSRQHFARALPVFSKLPDFVDAPWPEQHTAQWLKCDGRPEFDEESGFTWPHGNDFLSLILGYSDEIRNAHKTMYRLSKEYEASVPVLSGSGASLFCLLMDDAKSESMASNLRAANIGWITVAHTCPGGIL